MADYISPAVGPDDGDPAAIEDNMVAHLQTRIPGWEAQDGTPERFILESVAIEQAETRDAANGSGQTFEQIARWLSVNAFEFPALDPVAATATATVTAVDNAGYTVEAGMEITVQGLEGERVGFSVVDDVEIPAATGKAVTGVAATDLFTATAHGYVVNQQVFFTGLTGGAGLTAGIPYYVIASGLAANTFKVSATLGGAAVNFTTDLTVGTVTAWPSTGIGEVDLIATVEGSSSNGVQSDALVEDLGFDWIVSIVLPSPSAGGSDGETDLEHLDRFVRHQRLSSTHLIIPRDFEQYAPEWQDDVYGSPVDRALAIDLYNPADSTYDNEGMVTVAVIDEDGAALSAPIMAALKADMQSKVQAGMVVNVIAPTYTSIDVTFSHTTRVDFTPADVTAAAEAAVEFFLSPANWGRPDARVWEDEPIVDIGSVEAAILATPGVHRATVLTIEGGTVDVTLSGVPALPTPGSITGTAV